MKGRIVVQFHGQSFDKLCLKLIKFLSSEKMKGIFPLITWMGRKIRFKQIKSDNRRNRVESNLAMVISLSMRMQRSFVRRMADES